MKLYTKTGDGGSASTIDRRNLPKDSPVFELLGTLDELGAALGAAKCAAPQMEPLIAPLQGDLIGLSGELAGGAAFADDAQVGRLETAIDSIAKETPEFSGFVLPGKTAGGAALDLARTVARRAERRAVAYASTGRLSPAVIKWLNRLSDLIYAMARLADQGSESPARASPPPAAASAGRALDRESAEELCREVLRHGRETGLRAVAAVCDGGGNLMALLRDDGAYLVSIQLAQDKAYTAVAVKMTTEQLGRMAQPGGELDGIQHTDCRMVVFGGGTPITQGGVVIGGLGVSGGTARQDTELAEYGARLAKQMFDS